MGLDGINNRKAEITEKRDSLQNKAIDISARRAELNAKIAEELKKSDGTNEEPKDLAKSWINKEPDVAKDKNTKTSDSAAKKIVEADMDTVIEAVKKAGGNAKIVEAKSGEKTIEIDLSGLSNQTIDIRKKEQDINIFDGGAKNVVEVGVDAVKNAIGEVVKSSPKIVESLDPEKAVESLQNELDLGYEAKSTQQEAQKVLDKQPKELKKIRDDQIKNDFAPKFIDDNPSE